ncbi:MAG: hypothetical protein P8N02_17700, partial [Actinomycetota bacterium]|nr:hypothetical protein [Actinomycetota bacterium]
MATIDRPGREWYVTSDLEVVGFHERQDPTSIPQVVVMTRGSGARPWAIAGMSSLLTRELAGGELEEGHFVGLGVDDEVTHVGPITVIDRADVGASGTYSNDRRDACFFYELEELGRYPICLFAEEVHVPSNTFGAVFVPVHGTDVLLAFGWAGRAPRWRYWTIEGEVHELFYSVRASAGRAFIFGVFAGQPRSFRVAGVEVPVSREVSGEGLLFERTHPPTDAVTVEADAASAWLWEEPGGVTWLGMGYQGFGSELVCNGELRD